MHIAKWKKPTRKGYILNDYSYMAFWKRQIIEIIKTVAVAKASGGGEDE